MSVKDLGRLVLGAGKVAVSTSQSAALRLLQLERKPRPAVASSTKLYETHQSIEPWEKVVFTTRAALSAINDPYLGGDMVAAVGETTGEVALGRLLAKMEADVEGRQILAERPELSARSLDMEQLMKLAPDTLGGAYARYYKLHGFQFGVREPVRYIDNSDKAYVMKRYREIHDVLHVLVGFPVSVTGEIALKWFELKQTGLPMTALAAFFGPLRAEPDLRPQLFLYVDAALASAKSSALFMNLRVENYWDKRIPDLREEKGIKPLPYGLASLDAAWNGDPYPLIRHYEQAINALQDGKSQPLVFQVYYSVKFSGR